MIYILYALRERLKKVFTVAGALGFASLAITVIVTGTFLFYLTEPILPSGAKNTLFSSFYYVITTVTTVGYGDIYPTNFWSRMVFFYIVIFGLASFAGLLTEITSYLANKRFLEMRGLRHSRLKEHVIIIGYNDTTEELVKRLKSEGIETIVVDEHADAAALKVKDIVLISGNPLSHEVLERAGISKCSSLVIASQPDEVSVMIALKVHEINPSVRIVSSCLRYENFNILNDANIDVVIPLSRLHGDMLADAVMDSKAVNFLLSVLGGADGLDLFEREVQNQMKLSDVQLEDGERIIALYSSGKFNINFSNDSTLSAGDAIISIKLRKMQSS